MIDCFVYVQLAYECFFSSLISIFSIGFTVLGKLWTFLLSFLCLLSTFLKINLGSLSCILGLYSQHSRFQHMGPWIFNFHYFGVLRSLVLIFLPVGAGWMGAYTYTHRDGILVVVRSCDFGVGLRFCILVYLFHRARFAFFSFFF